MLAFFKVVAVLVLMAVLVARRVEMGAVLLIAAGAMLVLFWTPPYVLFDQMTAPGAKFFPGTGRLMVLIIFINTFGHLLSLKPDDDGSGGETRSGTRQLIDAVATLLRDPRAVVAATPSLIGLLPMPGGALLSAPMVEEISAGVVITPEKKTAVNFWYRHIYEYLFPIYPGIWVMAEVLSVSAATVIGFNWPLTFLMVLAGLTIFIGIGRKPGYVAPPLTFRTLGRSVADVLRNLWPVLTIVVLFVLVWAAGYKATWVVTAGLPVVVIAFGLIKGRSLRKIPAFIRTGAQPRFLTLVIAAMIFKEVVDATGAVGDISRFLRATSIPPVALCVMLPYLAGFLTGITVAFLGISLPLLMDFVMPGGELDAGLAMVVFAGGFMGVMTSPAHLCLVLSRDFYGADLAKTYRYLVAPAALVIAGALALHLSGVWGS